MEKEKAYAVSCYQGSYEGKDEKTRVAWEDKSTGDYYRYNAAEKITDTEYRRYENVSLGNKATGHYQKYYAEEKYPIGQTSKDKGASTNYVIQHY